MRKTIVAVVQMMLTVAICIGIGHVLEWVLDSTNYVVYGYDIVGMAFEGFVYGSVGFVLLKVITKITKFVSDIWERFNEWAVSVSETKDMAA